MSREGSFLLNNLLFVLFTFTVLIGTVFPLVVEAMSGRQMSVGRPYFDSMVVPIGAALLFLLGVGPALPWGRASRDELRRALLPPLIGGVALAIAGVVLGVRSPWAILTLVFGGYALQVTLKHLFSGARITRAAGRRHVGAYVVHLGAGIAIIAIAVSTANRAQHEITLKAGQSKAVGAYTLTFTGSDVRTEPHRTANVARIDVAKKGARVTLLEPRMNQYERMREPIGTPDVHSTIAGDLYVSIASLEDSQVSLLVITTPLVSWIWGAVLLMAIGGLICIVPMPLSSRAGIPVPHPHRSLDSARDDMTTEGATP